MSETKVIDVETEESKLTKKTSIATKIVAVLILLLAIGVGVVVFLPGSSQKLVNLLPNVTAEQDKLQKQLQKVQLNLKELQRKLEAAEKKATQVKLEAAKLEDAEKKAAQLKLKEVQRKLEDAEKKATQVEKKYKYSGDYKFKIQDENFMLDWTITADGKVHGNINSISVSGNVVEDKLSAENNQWTLELLMVDLGSRVKVTGQLIRKEPTTYESYIGSPSYQIDTTVKKS